MQRAVTVISTDQRAWLYIMICRAVREAAIECLQEMYKVLGASLVDHLRRQSIRPAIYKEMVAKLDEIEPTGIVVQDVAAPGAPINSSGGAAGGVASRRSDSGSAPDTAGDSSGGRRTGQKEASTSSSAGSAGGSITAPIHVASEQDLASELGGMVVPLTGTVADWQQRVGLLQRLQGLALGCTPHLLEPLVEGLRQLREPLVSQVEDRRSAVSKLACAALATMSSVLGSRFAEHLLYFLPVLFRILPITVQVWMAAGLVESWGPGYMGPCMPATHTNCQCYT
jgi:CLIP-associating protein 1/2